MPFLTRKSGDTEPSVLIEGALGASDGLDWKDNEYRPSRSSIGLDGLGLHASKDKVPQRRSCGNAECTGGWTRPWRNSRRPVFEGQWGCSGRCVLTMVRAAVRRELSDGGASMPAVPHRHRVPLGLVMLAQGWITHIQLQKALSAQRRSGTGRIGDWLISECGLNAEQITRGLSMQWGCPVLTTDGFSSEAMALVMPKAFAQEFGILPLRLAGSQILYLGFADQLDASAAFAIEQMTELKVVSGVVEGGQFESARRRMLASNGVDVKSETTEDRDEVAVKITAILEQRQPILSRLVRVHHYYWLRLWLERGAVGKVGSLPATSEDVKDYLFTVRAQQ